MMRVRTPLRLGGLLATSLILASSVVSCRTAAPPQLSPQQERLAKAYEARAEASRRKSVRVIARVEPPGGPEDMAGVAAMSQVLARTLAKYETKYVGHIEGTPFLVAEVSDQGIDALLQSDGVVAVVEDRIDEPFLLGSIPLIRADDAWSAGFEGNGQSVVVLDTGIDRSHPFFAGRIVGEACFSSNVSGDSATTLCPNGSTQQAGAGAAQTCDSSVDGCGHGTHVAGIAAGASGSFQGQTIAGTARGASIVAIQVFSRFNDAVICQGPPPCALSYTSDQIRALQHVRDIVAQQHTVASVNMSLGGGHYATACDTDLRKDLIDDLRALGIATVVASGNRGYSSGIGAPACISSAISVGSTSKSDGISSFSNSATILDLLAPGSSIRSSVDGGSYGVKSGTSMATPHVAGAWAVLKSQRTDASVDDVLEALRDNGKGIQDPRNGITRPRIDVGAAINGNGPCSWWPW